MKKAKKMFPNSETSPPLPPSPKKLFFFKEKKLPRFGVGVGALKVFYGIGENKILLEKFSLKIKKKTHFF